VTKGTENEGKRATEGNYRALNAVNSLLSAEKEYLTSPFALNIADRFIEFGVLEEYFPKW